MIKNSPKKKRIDKMDVILIILAVALIIFTVAMIQTFLLYGAIPDTLCACVFTVCGGECGAMAWIKTTKERNRERKFEKEDREYYDKKEKAAQYEAEQETEE